MRHLKKNALFLVRFAVEQALCSHSALEYVEGRVAGCAARNSHATEVIV